MRRNSAIALVAILVLGLVPRLAGCLLPPERLVLVVPDDAFYYFQTARHIAAGEGSAFDGQHPTNGYHPLWMGICVTLARLVEDPWQLARAALLLACLLQCVTGWLLWRLVATVTGRGWAGLVAAGLYLLNWRAILAGLNGLETALSTLLLIATVGWVAAERRRPAPSGATIGLGILFGLLFLARTDNAFYLLAMLVWLTARAPGGWRRLALVVPTAGLVALPWLLWNKLAFGSFIQNSGKAFCHMLQVNYRLEGNGPVDFAIRSAGYLVDYLAEGLYDNTGWSRAALLATLGLLLLAVGSRWGDPRLPGGDRSRELVGLLGALAGGAVALVLVHTVIRWYPREWYVDSVTGLLALSVGLCAGLADPLAAGRRLARVAWPGSEERTPLVVGLAGLGLVVLLGLPLQTGARRVLLGAYPHQAELYAAGRWVAAHVPADEPVAAFNSGIISYAAGRPVVNLDGVISAPAYEALRERRLARFMAGAEVRWLVDYQPAMTRLYAAFLGPASELPRRETVASIEPLGGGWLDSTVQVERLTWPAGARRALPRSGADRLR